MEHVQCIVVGAGVVRLACARALALSGRQTIVLEAESGIGRGISSRSSEVIHAGICYAPGSLKASLCVEGRHRLYDYLASRRLPHRRLGKLIVATDHAQLAGLEKLQRRAQSNGVAQLRWLSHDEAVEPSRADCFYPSIRRYWPSLPDGALQPAYAGIRPRLHGSGQVDADLVIQGPDQHGLPGLVQLFGIESPGLVSSLAIADRVLALTGAAL
jgi:L-2-hydroxyglutarate oxidase LhgO